MNLLDLPAEIRVMIFEHALVLPHPIEYWPAEDYSQQLYPDRRSYGRFIGRRELDIGLLRTCSLIHQEASEVFYRQNEFSCSSANGCMIALDFLHTITPRNWQWITNLTIVSPFWSARRSIHANEGNPEDRVRASSRTLSEQFRWEFTNFFSLLVWKLIKAPRLVKLRWVLLDGVQLCGGVDFQPCGGVDIKTRSMMEDLDKADFKIRGAIEDMVVAKPDMAIKVVSL